MALQYTLFSQRANRLIQERTADTGLPMRFIHYEMIDIASSTVVTTKNSTHNLSFNLCDPTTIRVSGKKL